MLGSAELLAEFEAPQHLRARGGAYLCSNSMGIIPRSAWEYEAACVAHQGRSGILVWDEGDWMGVLNRYAAVIGRYLGVHPSQVCPVTNITDGIWRVLSSLRFTPERPVLLQTDMEFTTQVYANFGFERLGARVVTVPADPAHQMVPTERLVAAIYEHSPVVLNLSHAAFESGYRHDLKAVAAACREVGTVFLLDAAQTGFVLPLSLEETGADVILLQQHKWGCGGTGAACLVARQAFIQQHAPALVGWMSHAETFAFEKGPARFGSSAWRYCGGTPDVPAKARGAVAAEIIVDVLGIEAVYAHNQKLVARLLDGLRELAKAHPRGIYPIELPQRAGFVVVETGSLERARALEHGMRARGLVHDSRGSRLRIGPTFYNDEGDIDRCVRGLAEVQKELGV